MTDYLDQQIDDMAARRDHEDRNETQRIEDHRANYGPRDQAAALCRDIHYALDSVANDVLRLSEKAQEAERLIASLLEAGDLTDPSENLSKLEDEVYDLRDRLETAYKAVLR